jgi:hypothetical protein
MSEFGALHTCYVLAVLSYFPSVFFCLAMVIQEKNLIIRAPKLKINYSFVRWDVEAKYAAAIWVGVIFFIMLAPIKHVFRRLDMMIIGLGPIALAIAGTIALYVERFKLLEVYKDNSKLIKTIFVFSALFVGYFASTMTNTSIAEYTHTNASNFPDAQRVITTLASIGVWLYAAVVISMIAYGSIVVVTLVEMRSSGRKSKQDLHYKLCLVGRPSRKLVTASKDFVVLVSLLIGTSVTVTVSLVYLKAVKVSSIDNFAKYLLVETSFQLAPELCGIDAPKGSKMSLLPFRQAAVAVPSENVGYQFAVIECNRTFDEFPPRVAKSAANSVEASN